MEDKVRKMKANAGDKTVVMDCSTCEVNFGDVCAGHGTRTDNCEDTYGMAIEEACKMLQQGCDDYGISFDAFIEQE